MTPPCEPTTYKNNRQALSMTSFDSPGTRPETFRLHPAPTAASVSTAQPTAISLVEVLQGLLDAAEQRNAEDSPSSSARQSCLGLTG
ncbi:hypothetical protein PCA10_19180 [Metapseudomonas resinovorans NBRC 106553]|uniref:Uncharacterized protein n=1 Tax=Metapseudomonas resinovorans NBRC 106553 TaxID=1245471 RepID=S6AHC9_METRE|nr:hypothetical protein PCA10_19180 [Pseudomonas resinovorans NBRC 106553]